MAVVPAIRINTPVAARSSTSTTNAQTAKTIKVRKSKRNIYRPKNIYPDLNRNPEHCFFQSDNFCVGIFFTEPLAEIKKNIVSASGSILNRFAIHPVKLSKVFGTPASLVTIPYLIL